MNGLSLMFTYLFLKGETLFKALTIIMIFSDLICNGVGSHNHKKMGKQVGLTA